MHSGDGTPQPVRAGALDGLGKVYSQWGGLLCQSGEEILKSADGWEMNVRSPWRHFLPGMIFFGYGGSVSSRLYVTTDRIVLIREIDIWREIKGELTPLGLPNAAAKEADLKRLQAAGARQYCELWPKRLRISREKNYTGPRSVLDLFLKGTDGREYAVSMWKAHGADDEMLSLIRSRFVS